MNDIKLERLGITSSDHRYKCSNYNNNGIQSLNRSVQLFDGSMTADWLIDDRPITDDR